jgi:peptidoglycan/LPS O-acetylase OafA/YrhL
MLRVDGGGSPPPSQPGAPESNDMTSRPDQRSDIARGVMMLGVLHVHALIALRPHTPDLHTLTILWAQVKLMAPHVALFFALAGMTHQSLADRSLRNVASRSLMLVMVAALSHVGGVALQYGLWTSPTSAYGLARDIAKPLIYGSGHWTFVTWFLIVLAVARLFAYALATSLRAFVVAAAGAAVAVALARWLDLTDDLYGWRHWPAAVVLLMLGARIPAQWHIPNLAGAAALLAGFALTAINRPSLLSEGICVTCNPEFVATTRFNELGVLPIYALQELLCMAGLLWMAQTFASTPLARPLAWLGRNSLALLVVHGWMILSAYGLVRWVWPGSGGAWLFAVVFIVNVALHALALALLRQPLDRMVLACSAVSRRIVTRASRLLRSRGRWTLPLRPS